MGKKRIIVVIPTGGKDVDVETIDRKIGVEHEVHVIQNKDGRPLTEVYGEALGLYGRDEEAIIVFMHDDLTVTTRNWGVKLIDSFERTGYGIIGVAGSEVLPSDCRWWGDGSIKHGRVMHSKGGNCWLNDYGNDTEPEYEVCVVDGLFMAVDPSRIKRGFDRDFGGFDFYDVCFCIDNFLEGVKVGVTNEVSVVHGSVGELSDNWYVNQKKAVEKYNKHLPISTRWIIKN